MHEQQVWDLRQRGWSQQRIAAEVGVSQVAICKTLQKIQRREYQRLAETIELHKVTQTAVLEHLLDESLQAWERSKRQRRSASERSSAGVLGVDGKPAASAKQLSVQDRDGDPGFLDRAFAALDRIRKIWGIDAPVVRDAAAISNYAEIVQRIQARSAEFEQRISVEVQTEPSDRGGDQAVPDGPGPV